MIFSLFYLKSSFCFQYIQVFAFHYSPLVFLVSGCFRERSKINVKIYDAINYLNETCSHEENVHEKPVPELCLILVNKQEQELHAINSFKNKIF